MALASLLFMFGIGTPELIVILVVALLVLGPKRLPEVARSFGKTLAELRKATAGMTEELRNASIALEQEARAVTGKPPGKSPQPEPAPSAPQSVAQAEPPPGPEQSAGVKPTDFTT